MKNCILFRDKERVGEISECKISGQPQQTRNVLGKEILMRKPPDLVEFVSPKPVNRKDKLWLLSESGERLILSGIVVREGTKVTASVLSRQETSSKV